MVLSDRDIRGLKFIEPCQEPTSGNGVISHGITSYGYDATLGNQFKVLKPRGAATQYPDKIIDPKNFDQELLEDVSVITGQSLLIPPGGFVLGTTKEVFTIPRNIVSICLGKSTYARCGILINVTPLEPEWKGQVTLEISNPTCYPSRIYAGEGICQFLFLVGYTTCEQSYADKKGKYQNQIGITTAKVV